ncbi:hypothetical protein [Streptomyces sp. NPDC006645]|uniref:hypothetical protein n=1 Tax=unclassified Streptomyces TaxID=2593676 RepID=UPI0033B679C6
MPAQHAAAVCSETRPRDRADRHRPCRVEIGARDLRTRRAQADIKAYLDPRAHDGAPGGTGDRATHCPQPAPDRRQNRSQPRQQRGHHRQQPRHERPETDQNEAGDDTQDVRPHRRVELLRVLLGRLVQLVREAVDRLADRPRLLGGQIDLGAQRLVPGRACLVPRHTGDTDTVRMTVDSDAGLMDSVTELNPGITQSVHIRDLDIAEYGFRIFHGGNAFLGTVGSTVAGGTPH